VFYRPEFRRLGGQSSSARGPILHKPVGMPLLARNTTVAYCLLTTDRPTRTGAHLRSEAGAADRPTPATDRFDASAASQRV